ncbi:unnamed protein product [Acanthoscelides obtectus]|uniref:Uncharacterized protein n=1 Tax=Acanthoscelides obtectus TaxID=200917 RepID=A0A9P0VR61_ACAOB|nr:unnamed protein product [Acanthoscelides obtectus]CAK1689298.1 hypothetical protein AOBTE_LOCUS37154 [Acanthoscelides obtectus]
MSNKQFSRSSKIHGGVCIYVNNKFSAKPLCDKVLNISEELHFEVAGVTCLDGTQILTIYRSPNGDFNIFYNKLQILLSTLDYKQNIIISGDFILNLTLTTSMPM